MFSTDSASEGRARSCPPPSPRVRVELVAGSPSSVMGNGFSVSLWVRRDWWPGGDIKPKARIPIRIRSGDLRLRHLPNEPSLLRLFGQSLTIDHNALPLDLDINCWVEVLEVDSESRDRLRARVLSGAIRSWGLERQPHALIGAADLFAELWPAGAVVSALSLGAVSFHIELLDQVLEQGGCRDRRRRLLLLAPIKGEDSGNGFLWRQVACNKAIGPHGTPPPSDPDQRIRVILAVLQRGAQQNAPIPLRFERRASEDGGVYFAAQRSVKVEEILRSSLRIYLRGDDDDGVETRWLPGTLKVVGDNFAFYDYDEVSILERTGLLVKPRSHWDVKISPKKNRSRLERLPTLYATGTDPTAVTGLSFAWQYAEVELKDIESVPVPVWVRHRVGDRDLSPKRIGSGYDRLPGLGGPLVFDIPPGDASDSSPWALELDVPSGPTLDPAGSARGRLRMVFNISGESITDICIDAAFPQLELRSPPTDLFGGLLPDPAAVPHPLRFHQHLRKGSLVFRNVIEADTGGNPKALVLKFDKGPHEFNLTCRPGTVVTHAPARAGLIDPISASGGNLVPQDHPVGVDQGQLQQVGERTAQLADSAPPLEEAFTGASISVFKRGGEVQQRAIVDYAPSNHHQVTVAEPWNPVPALGDRYRVSLPGTALPRDPNQGLVSFYLTVFQMSFASAWTRLIEAEFTSGASTSASVPAVFPWSTASAKANSPDPWEVEIFEVHHRNLILEHSELKSAFPGRTVKLPAQDAMRAVRDRFTRASENLLSELPQPLTNWLTGADLQDKAGAAVNPTLALSADSRMPRVEAKVVGGTQELALDTHANWLSYDVVLTSTELLPEKHREKPRIVLGETGSLTRNHVRGLTGSAAPMLYAPHAVTGLGVVTDGAGRDLLAVAGGDGHLRLVGLDTSYSNDLPVIENGELQAMAVRRVLDKTIVLTSGDDGAPPKVWEAYGTPLTTITEPERIGQFVAADLVSVFESGLWALSALNDQGDGIIEVWQPFQEKGRRVAWTVDESVLCAMFVQLDGGLYALAGFADGQMRLWDCSSKDQVENDFRHDGPINAVAFDPASGRLVTAGADHYASVWVPLGGIGDWDRVQQLRHPAAVTSLTLYWSAEVDRTPSELVLVTGAADGLVRRWHIAGKDNEQEYVDFRQPLQKRGVATRGPCVCAVATLPVLGREGTLLTGTDTGLVQAWDSATGLEKQEPRIQIDSGLNRDGLGVLRPGGLAGPTDDGLTLETVRVPTPGEGRNADQGSTSFHECWSVTYNSKNAIAERDLPGAGQRITGTTQIFFACHGLLIEKSSGKIIDRVGRAQQGIYRIYSNITSDHSETLGKVDGWPRLAGVPIRVTRLTRMAFDNQSKPSRLTRLHFEAALVGPTDFRGPDVAGDVPAFVHTALARGSVLHVVLDLDDDDYLIENDSRLDFVTTHTGQVVATFPDRGFSGSLARIRGNVRSDRSVNAAAPGALVINPDEEKTLATIFGRQWKLDGLPDTLSLNGHFVSRFGGIVQTDYFVAAIEPPNPGSQEPLHRFSVASDSGLSPRFAAIEHFADLQTGGDPLEDYWTHLAVLAGGKNTGLWDPFTGVCYPFTGICDPDTDTDSTSIDKVSAVDLVITDRSVTEADNTGPDNTGQPRLYLGIAGKINDLDKIRIRNPVSGKGTVVDYPTNGSVRSFAFARGWRHEQEVLALLYGTEDGRVSLLDVEEPWDFPPTTLDFGEFSSPVTAVAYLKHQEHSYVIAGFADGNARLWVFSPDQGPGTDPVVFLHGTDVVSLTLGADVDGSVLALVGYGDNRFRLWQANGEQRGIDLEGCDAAALLPQSGDYPSVPLEPGLHLVAAWGSTVRVYRAGIHDQPLWEIRESAQVLAVDAMETPDGPRLLTTIQTVPPEVHHWALENVLRISATASLPVQASLSTRFSLKIQRDKTVRGGITPGNRLSLWLNNFAGYREEWARPALEQGIYHCFLLGGVTVDRQQGSQSLVAWLDEPESATGLVVDSGHLASMLIDEHQQADFNIRLPGLGTPRFIGTALSMDVSISHTQQLSQTLRAFHVVRDTFDGRMLSLQAATQVWSTTENDVDRRPNLTAHFTWRQGREELQGPVRLRHIQGNDYALVPSIYLARKVMEPADNTTRSRADILFPKGRGQGVRKFDLKEVAIAPDNESIFLLLDTDVTGPCLRRIDSDQIPLALCLESDAYAEMPKLPRRRLQLIHRENLGPRLRLHWSSKLGDLIDQVQVCCEAFSPFEDAGDSTWLLSPLVEQGGLIRLLEDNLKLVESEAASPTSGAGLVQTENLLILQRRVPIAASAADPRAEVYTALNVTGRVGDSGQVLLTPERIQRRLLQTGSVGVVVHRTLTGGGAAVHRFVASPFYTETSAAANTARQQVPLLASTAIASRDQNRPTLDPRSLPPRPRKKWQSEQCDGFIPIPDDQPPLLGAAGIPYRSLHLRRVERSGMNGRGPSTNSDEGRYLHLREATAFTGRQDLWRVPERRVPREGAVGAFVPMWLQIVYAVDKPGAMLYHQALETRSDADENLLGPLPPLALRDPQHFVPPPGAAIHIVQAEPKVVDGYNSLKDLQMQWTDVIGELTVDREAERLPASPSIIKDDRGRFLLDPPPRQQPPLRVFMRLQHRLLEIGPGDAHLPLVFLPLQDGQKLHLRPDLYLLTRFDLTEDIEVTVSEQAGDATYRFQAKLKVDVQGDTELIPIGQAFCKNQVGGLYLWTLARDSGVDWQAMERLQITWVGNRMSGLREIARPESIDAEHVDLWPRAKPIKTVRLSELSPKVAAVLTLRRKESLEKQAPPTVEDLFGAYQRTLLFGNAAPPEEGEASIEDGERAVFRFAVQDQGRVTVAIPDDLVIGADCDASLMVIKYLLNGQTVFGKTDILVDKNKFSSENFGG